MDLQKDRLDDYSGQLETARIAREGHGSKLVELETTQERLWTKVQTLEEAFQQEKEKNQEQARQLQVLCLGGWPKAVTVGKIIIVCEDQSQVWQSMPFGVPSCISTNTPFQGQLALAVSEYMRCWTHCLQSRSPK